jgi:hypothetical protein
VKTRWLGIVVLLWLGWYISGPIAETCDFWDTPRQEFHDITTNAGGGIVLLAAAFGLGMAAARKWREIHAPVSEMIRRKADRGLTAWSAQRAALNGCFEAAHSPPIPLRI